MRWLDEQMYVSVIWGIVAYKADLANRIQPYGDEGEASGVSSVRELGTRVVDGRIGGRRYWCTELSVVESPVDRIVLE